MSFPCNQCGWCCQNLDKDKMYLSLDRGDGVCGFFDKEHNSCAIYETRPEICNIDTMYYSHFNSMEYDQYISLNVEICQAVQKANQLPVIQI